jgi:hypothetical protein
LLPHANHRINAKIDKKVKFSSKIPWQVPVAWVAGWDSQVLFGRLFRSGCIATAGRMVESWFFGVE